ncbi:hypothetical protein DW094_13730 [Ruminococcaceae bacterium AM07-15]|nr:hypothetical protein DW094_13730 [Ruminococcaceae bacterium AM07-15]
MIFFLFFLSARLFRQRPGAVGPICSRDKAIYKDMVPPPSGHRQGKSTKQGAKKTFQILNKLHMTEAGFYHMI